jgi:hypothetical protein
VAAVTVVAGVAVLVTGRYPRALFDFTVGVLRWTWRVIFYATGVAGTDRYPAFALRPVEGEAVTFELARAERLSRGLVLVKWWLLAIPHYVVVATLTSGPGDGRWLGWGGGLIGILVLVAMVRLLFTGRYPREMFGLLVGLNRWAFRVAIYALLLTDAYPPFRLDQVDDDASTGEATRS